MQALKALTSSNNNYYYKLLLLTGGMAEECSRYHSRPAELLSSEKQEDYATTMPWIRAKVSFAILRGALLWLFFTS